MIDHEHYSVVRIPEPPLSIPSFATEIYYFDMARGLGIEMLEIPLTVNFTDEVFFDAIAKPWAIWRDPMTLDLVIEQGNRMSSSQAA